MRCTPGSSPQSSALGPGVSLRVRSPSSSPPYILWDLVSRWACGGRCTCGLARSFSRVLLVCYSAFCSYRQPCQARYRKGYERVFVYDRRLPDPLGEEVQTMWYAPSPLSLMSIDPSACDVSRP